MADNLQGLLERINEEGMKKAESEREAILADARAKAAELVNTAQAEHDKLIADAKRESAKLVQAGEDKLRQAARDAIVGLEADIKLLTSNLVKGLTGEVMTPDFIANLIIEISKAYAASSGPAKRVDVLVPPAQLETFVSGVKAKLAAQFTDGVSIKPVSGLDAGVQVSFNGESVYHDFSDEAVTEILCEYVNPRLVELLRGSGE